ncbi:MAG: hypothetical protein V7676_18425 [Parasphingorhabdus sp.]
MKITEIINAPSGEETEVPFAGDSEGCDGMPTGIVQEQPHALFA